MLHVPGAAAQSTSPLGVCRMRRAVNDALNAPDASVAAAPVWVVSQSAASPELLFLHSAKPTDTFGVKPVPATVTVCRCTRPVDGVTVNDGVANATGVSAAGAVASGAVASGAVSSGAVVALGAGDVVVVVDGTVVDGSVVDGGASSPKAGAAMPMTRATTHSAKPTRSPRRRMVS